MKRWLADHRVLLGKFAFELAIVFVGVTAAFALENLRQSRDDAKYASDMIAALLPTFDDVLDHAAAMDRTIGGALQSFEAARARGERPPPPIYREGGAERPPTRIWDAVVATGIARTLKPSLLFRLASFYNRLESFGERYIRYNAFTESRVLSAGADPAVFYDADGSMKPEFRAHIDRLRDLQQANHELDTRARELREDLLKTK